MDWIHMTQDVVQWQAVVNTVTTFWVPQKAGNFLTSWPNNSFSFRTLHQVSA
jgi:hypothetical protein